MAGGGRRNRRSQGAVGHHAPTAHSQPSELDNNLTSSITEQTKAITPEATSKQYDPKIREYKAFCDHAYSNDTFPHSLTKWKLYRFMYYQSFREQKKRGGRRRNPPPIFDAQEYDRIISYYHTNNEASSETMLTNMPNPKKPIKAMMFEAYKSALRRYHRTLQNEGLCNDVWEIIWAAPHDELRTFVQTRQVRVDRANYVEKIGREFEPYAAVETYGLIEQAMWEKSAQNTKLRDVTSQIRHRYCLLHLTSGILRCESLYRAELSDFMGLQLPQRDNDIDPMYIMVNQISEGKTNKGRKLYGRATRHADPRVCCIGALGFYLALRFFQTREFHEFTYEDWCDNKKWFDIKLLADTQSQVHTKPLTNKSYSRFIGAILITLQLAVVHLCHLGRNIGAKLLQLLESPDDETRVMGQWNPSMVDNAYSAKLPIAPIRRLAGFTGVAKQYYLPRGQLEPPDELLKATPFAWCYDALYAFEEKNDITHPTATGFLRFICNLNRIFLQDAAALYYKHPSRKEHPMFKTLPVFQTEQFTLYATKMGEHLDALEANSPLDANLESVMPGIKTWHQQTHTAIRQLTGHVEDISGAIVAIADEQVAQRREALEEKQAFKEAILALARRIEPSAFHGHGEERHDNTISPPHFPPQLHDDNSNAMVTEDSTNVTNGVNDGAATSPDDHSDYRMRPKLCSLKALWNEWFGLEEFDDGIGGIDGRDRLHGSKWRKHLDNQRHSRHKRIVKGIQKFANDRGSTADEAIAALETVFTEECKTSPAKMVLYLQAQGLLPKAKARGRKAASSLSTQQATT